MKIMKKENNGNEYGTGNMNNTIRKSVSWIRKLEAFTA